MTRSSRGAATVRPAPRPHTHTHTNQHDWTISSCFTEGRDLCQGRIVKLVFFVPRKEWYNDTLYLFSNRNNLKFTYFAILLNLLAVLQAKL